jgi:hypothetical protein
VATQVVSGATYPTIGLARLVIIGIIEHLEECLRQHTFSQHELCRRIKEKLERYWEIVDTTTTISTVMDPRYKFSLFENHQLAEVKQKIRDLSGTYNNNSNLTETSNQVAELEQAVTSNKLSFFHQLRRRRFNESEPNPESSTLSPIDQELNRYELVNCGDDIDILEWWKTNQIEYPILSCIARDYLAIQATSTECERSFSMAGNTITDKRNRLDPETVRASLCLKSWISDEFDNIKLQYDN